MILGFLTPRNPSAEGSGRARNAWVAHAVQLLEEGGEDTTPSPFTTSSWTIAARDRKRVAAEVREFSEMMGFWVAWHSTQQALMQYRRRLAELDDELDAAAIRGDTKRHAERSAERDALIAELKRATGLAGRGGPAPRPRRPAST